MEILRLDGLCKQYPAFRLDNVSFSMEAGTIMGLIGRNGAGKTTTLKSMLHLVHPDAGDDHDLRAGYGHGRARDPLAHRLRLRRRVVLPAQAPARADGRHEGLLSRLGRRALCAARPAVFAGREQARLRAVRGHEGQVSAGGCHVAPGGAADPRRADVRARPCLARRAAGHVPDALRAGGRVDPLLHAHHLRPRRLRGYDHVHPEWPRRRQRGQEGAGPGAYLSCCRAATPRAARALRAKRASARAATRANWKRSSARRTPRWPPASRSRRQIWNRSWYIWNGRRKHEAADEKGMEADRHAGAAAVFAAERAGARAELSVLRNVFL